MKKISMQKLKAAGLMDHVLAERAKLKAAMAILKNVPLFSELNDQQLERLANSLKRKEIETDRTGSFPVHHEHYPEGIVIHQGDTGEGSHVMYVVESGKLQACVDVVRSLSNPDGVVKEYGAGDFFGELAIVTDQPRSATVRCTETCVLLELNRAHVLDLLPGQLNSLISAHRRQTAMQVLKKVPLFSDLTQSQIERLANNLKRKEILTNKDGFFDDEGEFPKGTVITQGDEGETMFVVESGRLQALVDVVKSASNPDGVVKEYSEGSYFGELALNTDDHRSATVRCTDDTVLLVLSKLDLPEEVFGRVDDKRLSYGVSTTMLSYGGEETYCCMAPGVVIHPDFWLCRYKDITMTLLILYSCTWEPFKAAFAEGDELNNISDLIVDLVYWADIVVNFITGYRTNNDVELDVHVIAKGYVSGWFIVDVAATFPWDVVAAAGAGVDENQAMGSADSGAGVGQLALLRLLRLIRILRILRMGRIVERLSNHFKIRAAFIKIVQLVVGLIIIIHLVACLFFMFSYLSAEDPISVSDDYFFEILDEDDLPTGEMQMGYHPTECESTEVQDNTTGYHPVQGTMVSTWVCVQNAGRDQGRGIVQTYLLAIYFSITTVSTIGYGDISPHLDNSTEMFFTVAVEFLGMFIFSYTVSNLADLVGNLNVANKEFHDKVDRYLEWMRDKDTPDGLRDRVLGYINACEGSEFIYTEEDEIMMVQLSAPLQVEMKQMVFHDTLKRRFRAIKTFETNDALLAEFTEDLAMCVRTCIAMENDLIVHRGELASQEIFILLRGKVRLMGNDLRRSREIIPESPYPFFGLAELLAKSEDDQYEHRSVIAAADSDLARISRSDFEDMIEKFPEVHTDLKAIGQADLDDVTSMDRSVARKVLQKCFDEACAKGSLGGSEGQIRKLSKQQFVDMLGCDTLQSGGACGADALCVFYTKNHDFLTENDDLFLARAMDQMDPVGEHSNSTPSTPRIDFGNFFRWWTTRNFVDPQGFSDMYQMVVDDKTGVPIVDPKTGEAIREDRPRSARTSLHFAERELQRGEGAVHNDSPLEPMASPRGDGGGLVRNFEDPRMTGGDPALARGMEDLCREVTGIERSVATMADSMSDVQGRLEKMETQMVDKMASLEKLLLANLGGSGGGGSNARAASPARAALPPSALVPPPSDDGARP